MTNNNVGELYRGMKERLENEAYVSNEVVCYVERVMGKKHCEDRGGETCCVACEERFTKNILAALEDAYELGKLKNDYWCGSAFEKGAELGKEIALPEGIEFPRFEDGELMQLGDEFLDGMGNTRKLFSVEIGESEAGVEYILWWDYPFAEPRGGLLVCPWEGDVIKRPQPEVYDADGVKIEEGMKVWYCYLPNNKAPEEHVVTGFTKDVDNDIYLVETKSGRFFLVSSIFVNKPVFDANGERIKEGDTVWELRTHDKLVIESIHTKEEAEWYVDEEKDYVKFTDGCWAYAENVTHIEPDTQAKIDEDAMFFIGTALVLSNCAADEDWAKDKMYQLLRRQRELCKRGEC